jgi:Skp family chaperone for outer membrane proteins
MDEHDAYVKKMEAEKQSLDARLAEVEAQSDIEKADAELDEVTGARERRETFRRKLDELRQKGSQAFAQLRARVDEARDAYAKDLEAARKKLQAMHGIWQRKREAELREFGAQVDQWEASIAQSDAESMLLTREEIAFLRRSLDTTGRVLKRMVGASDEDWGQLRQQYEATWKELTEHANRIRSSTVQEQPTSRV